MEEKYIKSLSKISVLLVDDDINLRSVFKKTMDNYVDAVYEAGNGNEALDIYKQKSPNIVITDIKMPLMDGLLFITVLRQLDKKIPIVAISGYSEPETLIGLIPHNLVSYLVKPINFEQLKSILVKSVIEIEDNGMLDVKLTKDSVYSYSNKSIKKNDEIISLTPNEIYLIELLIENENKLITISQIEHIVYKGISVTSGALNTLVSKLRKKIGENIIKAIPSHGYIMVSKD